jgi:primary-amine oxidase
MLHKAQVKLGLRRISTAMASMPTKRSIRHRSRQCQIMMATSAEHGQMANTNKLNAYSRKPVSYRLVSREVPKLLPKENGIVWKRTCFERRAVHVTKCKVIPQLATCRSLTSDFGCRQSATSAGRHVPQSSGEPSKGIPEWIAANPTEKIDNTDIVLWHIFGITHFPAPEDYPIMPAEPMTLLLRPRNFFTRNAALDVPPSSYITRSQKLKEKSG